MHSIMQAQCTHHCSEGHHQLQSTNVHQQWIRIGKIIQHRISQCCVWPIDKPHKRGKDAARLVYEHVKQTHASAKSRDRVLTDLNQIIIYLFLLNNDELQEMNVIRDKAFAGGAVKSTHQLLNATLGNEAGVKAHGNSKGSGNTPTERQLAHQALGQ